MILISSDLLAASEMLDSSIRECIRTSLDDFYDKQMKEIQGTIKKKLEALDEAMRVWLTRRDDILATFKVTYGHPATRNSLNQVRDEILQEEQQMQDTILEKFDELKVSSIFLRSPPGSWVSPKTNFFSAEWFGGTCKLLRNFITRNSQALEKASHQIRRSYENTTIERTFECTRTDQQLSRIYRNFKSIGYTKKITETFSQTETQMVWSI